MTHLFISHSTRDGGPIAQQLSAALEAAGHRCWIAPRDVKPGVPYPGQIVTAIEGSAGLVLLVTPAANESPDVLQEIQLASTARKTIAPVIVSGCTPGPDLRYFLGVRHQIPWSDAPTTAADLLRTFPIGSAWAPSLTHILKPRANPASSSPKPKSGIAVAANEVSWKGARFGTGDQVRISSKAGTFKPAQTGHTKEVCAGPGQVGLVLGGIARDASLQKEGSEPIQTVLVRFSPQTWTELHGASVRLPEFEDSIHADYLELLAPASEALLQDGPQEDLVELFMIAHGPNKINVIKVIREYTGMGLAETKLMIEGFSPVRVARSMLRSRAQAFAQDLKAQGAVMLDLPPSR